MEPVVRAPCVGAINISDYNLPDKSETLDRTAHHIIRTYMPPAVSVDAGDQLFSI